MKRHIHTACANSVFTEMTPALCRRLFLWAALAALTVAAPVSYADAFSAEELLALPQVEDYRSNVKGDVAWVERAAARTSIFVARAPSYRRELLHEYAVDDGVPVRLLGFGPKQDVIFLRGRHGFNPAFAAKPSAPAIYAVNERRTAPRALLDPLTVPLSAFAVSPDQKTLFLAQGGDVLSLPLSGRGNPELLFSARGSIRSLLPSPDGKRLAFISDRAGYERGKYAFAGVFELGATAIRYLEPGLGVDQDLTWAPDSQQVAFIRFGYEPKTWRFSDHREGAPFDVMVVDASTGRGGAVFTSAPGYGSRFNGFYSSGYSGLGGRNSLLWMANGLLVFPYEKTGWKQLYAVPASGGALQQLSTGRSEVKAAVISSDRRVIHYLSNTESDPDRLRLFALSLDTDLKPSPVSFAEPGAMPLNLQPLATGGVVYEFAGPQSLVRLVVAKDASSQQQLSSGPVPDDSIGQRLPAPEVVSFTARDGLRIPMVVYKPAAIQGRHPVIVHSHGGPRSQVFPVWDTGFSYYLLLRYLASQGYYVFSVNFRSGTGYGLDFREPESYGGRGAGDVLDFIDAADFIKQHYEDIDPKRMAIYGHSYGGHNVTNALARSDAYAAGISSAGVGDWVTEMEKDFREVLQFNIPQRVELEQQAFDSSAISLIDQWGDEPLLLLHGDNDGSAAMQQSIELYQALRRRGKPVEAVVFPGEAHSIQRYESRLRYVEALDDFLQRYIGGAVATP
ncbi:MAG: prolyl oligopeptidase family serine peptidase [Pseudomonadota bacterium]